MTYRHLLPVCAFRRIETRTPIGANETMLFIEAEEKTI